MTSIVIEVPKRSDYGAVEVKKYIFNFTRLGFIISTLLLLLMWGGYQLQKVIDERNKAQMVGPTKIDIVDIQDQKVDEAPPPPPAPEVIQDLGTTVQAGTPNPVEDDQVQDVDFASFDEMNKALSTRGDIDISNIDLNNINLDAPRGNVNVNANESEGDDDEFKVFEKDAVVDYAALQKSIEYPEMARKVGAQGTVVVKVRIEANGKASNAKILSSDHKLLNDAAIKAVMSFQDYKPAIQNKQPVAQWLSIPLKFRLN